MWRIIITAGGEKHTGEHTGRGMEDYTRLLRVFSRVGNAVCVSHMDTALKTLHKEVENGAVAVCGSCFSPQSRSRCVFTATI